MNNKKNPEGFFKQSSGVPGLPERQQKMCFTKNSPTGNFAGNFFLIYRKNSASTLPHHPLRSIRTPIRTSSAANRICKFRPEQPWAHRTPSRASGMVVTARIAKVRRSTYPNE